MKLLIDCDYIVYKCCAATETEIDFGEDLIVVTSNFTDAYNCVKRELEKIQNSKQNVDKFVFKSIHNIKESINIDLIKARPEAEIFFVDDGAKVQQNSFFFLVDPV